jgi:hypothetical protein
MPSPFPGMDPYLEDPAIWSDFHGTFLMSIRTELNRCLPEHYVARWDRYDWIDEPDAGDPRPLGRPDVFVSDVLNREAGAEATSLLLAPETASLPFVDAVGKPFLKIIDVRGRRVVTVLELLSPANKTTGKDRDAYLAKRYEYWKSGTNLVEMDFLRSGLRAPLEGTITLADYYIVVSRAIDYPKAGIWPLSVRMPLPTIPVPLHPQVEPVGLVLRSCFDRAYDEARFGEEIDYSEPPSPPLGDADAAWARQLLATRSASPSQPPGESP